MPHCGAQSTSALASLACWWWLR